MRKASDEVNGKPVTYKNLGNGRYQAIIGGETENGCILEKKYHGDTTRFGWKIEGIENQGGINSFYRWRIGAVQYFIRLKEKKVIKGLG